MASIDVVVVGAGPSGLLAAHEAAQKGAKVVVLEEDSEVGCPPHCAGLVSIEGLRIIGMAKGGFIQGWARGAILHSPRGAELRIDAGRKVAYIIDRVCFDKELAGKAQEVGVELKLRAKARGLIMDKGVRGVNAWVNGGGKSFRSKAVVDAEGARWRISSQVGLRLIDRSMIYPAAQLEFKGGDFEDGFVELFFSEAWAPGFFAWVVPFDDGCRVGLASKRGGCRDLLNRFVKKHPKVSARLRRSHPLRLTGGLLVLGGPATRTYANGLVLVGDAAGHVKPTTGGGVVFGGMAARIAGEEIANYSLSGRGEALERYEKRWKELIGRELKWMRALRKYLSSLSDEEYERLFHLAQRLSLDAVLSTIGDMDRHALTTAKLLLKPKLSPLLWLVGVGMLIENFKAGLMSSGAAKG